MTERPPAFRHRPTGGAATSIASPLRVYSRPSRLAMLFAATRTTGHETEVANHEAKALAREDLLPQEFQAGLPDRYTQISPKEPKLPRTHHIWEDWEPEDWGH